MGNIRRSEAETYIEKTLAEFNEALRRGSANKKKLGAAGKQMLTKGKALGELLKVKNFRETYLDELNLDGIRDFMQMCVELSRSYDLGIYSVIKDVRVVEEDVYEDIKAEFEKTLAEDIKKDLGSDIYKELYAGIFGAARDSNMEERKKRIERVIRENEIELADEDIPEFFMSGTIVSLLPDNESEPWWAKLHDGTDIHSKIAARYTTFHQGEEVYENTTPIQTILKASKASSDMLSEAEKRLRPDIVNMMKLHLYEIKPKGGEQLAKAEASMYQGVLNKALVPTGVFIQLGAPTELGVKGTIITNKNEVVEYASPTSGVIIYQNQSKKKKEPQPHVVLVAVPEEERDRAKSWLSREYWGAITGLTGLGLTLFMVYVVVSTVVPPVGVPLI